MKYSLTMLAIILMVSACKYDDGPKFSLRSKTHRAVNTWYLDKAYENGVDKRNMNAELMALMVRTSPMDAAQNYRYYMNQYPGSIQNRFMPVTNPFLNVFNWAKFLKQLKDNKKNK